MNLLERLEMMLNENRFKEDFLNKALAKIKFTHGSDKTVTAQQNFDKCISAIAACMMIDHLAKNQNLSENYKDFVKGLRAYSDDLKTKLANYMNHADKGFDFEQKEFSEMIKDIIKNVYKEGTPKKDE